MRRTGVASSLPYVYRLTHQGETLYIGKGTGKRLSKQRSSYKLEGEIIWECKSEKEAYKRERELVEMFSPLLNLCAGGGGSMAVKRRTYTRREPTQRELRIDVAKQLITRWPYAIPPSKIERIRQVANGIGL
jgi:hypothetical protein